MYIALHYYCLYYWNCAEKQNHIYNWHIAQKLSRKLQMMPRIFMHHKSFENPWESFLEIIKYIILYIFTGVLLNITFTISMNTLSSQHQMSKCQLITVAFLFHTHLHIALHIYIVVVVVTHHEWTNSYRTYYILNRWCI